MKQTTIKFDKRRKEPVTIQRLQLALDSIADGTQLTKAMAAQGLGRCFGKFLVGARVLARIDHKTVVVLKPKLERKDFYRIMDIQTKYNLQRRKNHTTISYQAPKADTDMQELLNLSQSKIVRTVTPAKPRVRKKAVALPWWKRFLLYLANH